MSLSRYTIWGASILQRRDTAVAPKSCRFNVCLHDDEGAAVDLVGFLVNREGQVKTPTAYMARSTKALNLIRVREDILESFSSEWLTNPRLREKLDTLGSFYEIGRPATDDDERIEVGG